MLPYAPSGEEGFALITVTPPAIAARTTPRDLTFVVDVSGSMRGQKMEQARAAGRQMLASLGSQDRFRIIDFSTDVRTFGNGFTTATRRNIDEANRYLDDLRPEGSTNISGALEEALDAPTDEARMPIVFFVTDGEPTVGERNADRIAALASRVRGRARVFTFGVGADVNAALVEQLAVDGRGTAQFVRPDESVERAVSLVATRITSPIVTDVRVRAEGVRLTKLHPSLPTDIFAGQDLVLFARYSGDGNGRIVVEGRTANGPVTWTEQVRFPEGGVEVGLPVEPGGSRPSVDAMARRPSSTTSCVHSAPVTGYRPSCRRISCSSRACKQPGNLATPPLHVSMRLS